jgi:hypothetical protein
MSSKVSNTIRPVDEVTRLPVPAAAIDVALANDAGRGRSDEAAPEHATISTIAAAIGKILRVPIAFLHPELEVRSAAARSRAGSPTRTIAPRHRLGRAGLRPSVT